MQMKRWGRLRCLATMAWSRFGYSGPNFVPHRMQITLTMGGWYGSEALSAGDEVRKRIRAMLDEQPFAPHAHGLHMLTPTSHRSDGRIVNRTGICRHRDDANSIRFDLFGESRSSHRDDGSAGHDGIEEEPACSPLVLVRTMEKEHDGTVELAAELGWCKWLPIQTNVRRTALLKVHHGRPAVGVGIGELNCDRQRARANRTHAPTSDVRESLLAAGSARHQEMARGVRLIAHAVPCRIDRVGKLPDGSDSASAREIPSGTSETGHTKVGAKANGKSNQVSALDPANIMDDSAQMTCTWQDGCGNDQGSVACGQQAHRSGRGSESPQGDRQSNL